MEQGATKIAKLLAFALLLGVAVTAFNSHYRQAFLSMVRGQPQENPIWQSNRDYYPDIVLPGRPAAQPATSIGDHSLPAAARAAAQL